MNGNSTFLLALITQSSWTKHRFSLFLFNQVYRVSDMELVRVLPSAEDEVNVACFHPQVGGGLVYGTKVSCSSVFWTSI